MSFLRADLVELSALFGLGGHSQDEVHRGLDPLAGEAQLEREMRGGLLPGVLDAVADEDVVGLLHLSDQEIDLRLLSGRTDGGGERRLRQGEREERAGRRFTVHSNP